MSGLSLRGLAVCGSTRDETFRQLLRELRGDRESLEAAELYLRLREGEAPPRRGGREPSRIAERALLLRGLRFSPEQRIPASRVREGMLAIAGDGRPLLLVLVDHLLALCGRWEEPRRPGAQLALHVLAPLAERLGLGDLQRELEDLAFRCVDRAAYDGVARLVALRRAERDALLAGLQGRGAEASLHDLLGLRIIVAEVDECYRLLGALHARFSPLPGRFKDYIARPKESGYQSLHSTLLVDDPRAVIEVQLRTRAMHERAERGDAAHWKYKLPGERSTDRAPWIHVLTPLGDVLRLPRGATPIDFAYAIHTDLGNRFSGAVVDGRVAKSDAPLETGQVVHVLTSARSHPTARQIERARTHHARNRIRAALGGR